MFIEALTFTPAANNEVSGNTLYSSAKVTARTFLKALRAIDEVASTKRLSYTPAIKINDEVFYLHQIHNFCQGCHSLKDAEYFLNSHVELN